MTLSDLRLFVCLLSRSRTVPCELYPSQACRPLKLESLSPAGCKKLGKSAPLVLPPNRFGEVFSLCISWCVSLPPPHHLSQQQGLTPLCSTHSLFPLQIMFSNVLTYSMWLIIYLLWCSLFCLSSVRFLVYLECFDSY